MIGIIKEINGQKKIVPLTTDTGTGALVGTLISQYKKVPMSGYLYCDGSAFDQNTYPALYMYLGTNVLPDYSNSVENGYVYIKATSGLAENQQENVLNDIKNYLVWNYKVVSCAGGTSGNVEIPAGYNGNYEYSIYDYNAHVSFHGIHITSDGTTSLGNIATNFGSLSNDGITLNNTNIGYTRESTAGDFRIAFRPIPNGIAI